ncbi:ATP-dependent RNA helicase HrpA [Agrococcus casei]|uniref:ATP-dependent helicase hrpA n=4 Tax=Agrococcus TaxID=46352 RepID=A0A1R4GBX4_9MICO|nr:ATP-dependent RNA helicase HrpA [Agrococcus casei]SJM65730.1 ATP-dependent helicase hrpA [Agrococcus casei LMG 22410]
MHIHYPPELPVAGRRDDILAALASHQVVIVAGETGSGKTTQLPKMLLEMGKTSIGHTQPRRIAARTIAERIADELGEEVGGTVGYKVRFTDQVSKETKLKVMTDGVLLAEIHRDRDLKQYDAIVIDEAHERSLTIDFLIGYLKRLLPRRPDLTVVITSATIDPESFSKHFDDAPIIEVSGRAYDVDVRYRPLIDEDDESDDDGDQVGGIQRAIREISAESGGDILVFFSGEADIRDTQDALRGKLGQGVEILPLYGRLSAADQHRVFEPSKMAGLRRRIVLATNVAETSLTVPGIRHVIDTGTARISRYSVRSKVQRLPIEAISQASANQRSGRAGRVAEGIAIRLYSEEDYERRPEYTDPEILRTNLASVILQAATLGIGELERFPFLTPPDSRGLKDGRDLLRELSAITPAGKVTKSGRELSRLPVDPRFARMVLAGRERGVAHETIAIVAALSIQDVRERPLEKRQRADELHARFADPTSDFISLLNLWRHLGRRQKELSNSAFRREVKSEFLNFLRIREWHDVVRQLSRAVGVGRDSALGSDPASMSTDADAIHKALLAGLLGHLGIVDATQKTQKPQKKGQRPQTREYRGARGSRFRIHPSSGLAKKAPEAVMAAELVETSQLFARQVAEVQPEWAEELAGDLAKSTIGEPHWEKKQGAVVAYERVTLFGVPIVERRRVQFARFDAEHARELFIRHALVEGDWESPEKFERQNRQLIREIERLEERQRRRDLLVDEDTIYDFFDARIPADVVSQRTFEGWWRKEKSTRPNLLTLTREALTEGDEQVSQEEFPTKWQQGEQRLRVSYRFSPGDERDGLTVHVPLAVLPRLSPAGFDWLVPGMREELLTAMIKALPKQIRRHIVPAGDWARSMLAELPETPTDLPLAAVLADRIQRKAHIPADASDVEWDRVPGHLQPTFLIENERGKPMGDAKSLTELQQRFGGQATKRVAQVAVKVEHEIERDDVAALDAELPDFIDVRQGGNVVRAYPGYTKVKGGHAVRMHATEREREAARLEAVTSMLEASIATPASYVTANLTQTERLALGSSPYRSTNALMDDVLGHIVDTELAAAEAAAPVTTPEQFEALRIRISSGVVERMFDVAALAAKSLTAARDADRELRDGASISFMAQLADARSQLDGLIYDGFIRRTGAAQLERLPVYLVGIAHRVKRLPETANRDRVWMGEALEATEAFTKAGGKVPLPMDAPEHLVTARWMLEELRLSLFAQQLGARGPVSVQRIRRALESKS